MERQSTLLAGDGSSAVTTEGGEEEPVSRRLPVRACQRLPQFARVDPGEVSCHRGCMRPLDEARWAEVVRSWGRPVTTVRRAAGTSVEGAAMPLWRAYNDPEVYIQCGLKGVEAPGDSAVWQAMHTEDRDQIRRVMQFGGRIFGRFDRVATFVTTVGASRRTTSTHYDEFNGFLCVVKGSKRVYVAAPSACGNTGSRETNETTQTPFDTGGFECYDLAAGDVLYVPGGHWHYVTTPAETVMLSFWFI